MASLDPALTIRPAQLTDAPGMAIVAVDTWRTAYRGLISDFVLDSLSYDHRARSMVEVINSGDPLKHTFVAEDQGQIVGFASCGPERDGYAEYPGELYAIYILEAYQGQGLGRRLVGAVAAALLGHGFAALLVWVLAANQRGRQFYAALGGQVVGEKILDRMGSLVEVAYGWPDLKLLVDQP